MRESTVVSVASRIIKAMERAAVRAADAIVGAVLPAPEPVPVPVRVRSRRS